MHLRGYHEHPTVLSDDILIHTEGCAVHVVHQPGEGIHRDPGDGSDTLTVTPEEGVVFKGDEVTGGGDDEGTTNGGVVGLNGSTEATDVALPHLETAYQLRIRPVAIRCRSLAQLDAQVTDKRSVDCTPGCTS